MHRALTILLLAFWIGQPGWAAGIDHAEWDLLLKSHVHRIDGGRATQLDYSGMLQERDRLKAYLGGLSAVSRQQFEQWPKEEQLAFLINAYNAWTVDLVLIAYPDLTSIRDLGSLFRSPWQKSFIPLLGETRSLDDIEHGLIRGSGRYRDPRIHFAVNCASIGCPALRAEAYTAAELERQLEQQTRLFLADRSRNRSVRERVQVSSIFKWYREDFEAGWRGARSLGAFLRLYAEALQLSEQQSQALQSGTADIEFLDYDWRLNDRKG